MKKKLITAILTGVLTLGLIGCGATNTDGASTKATDTVEVTPGSEENGEAALKPVRLGIPGTEDTNVILELASVAYDNGYFEEELNKKGYTLEPKYFAGVGPEINEAMAAGELDVAIYGDFPIFVTKSNGIDTTVVASVNSELQYSLLTTSDDIKEPKDLEGKRVVVPYGTVGQYFWERYVQEYDLDVSKIEVINSLDASSLLLSGEADVTVGTSYSLGALQETGLGTIFDTGADVDQGYSTQLVTIKTDYLKENPEVAVALNKALIRAYEDVKENPQVLYDTQDSPNISAEIWEEVYSYDTSFDYLTPEITDATVTYFRHLNDWLYDNSIIIEKIDIDSLYDTSYYKQAVEELGE